MTQQPPTGIPDPKAAADAVATATATPLEIPDISSSASKFVSNLENAGSAVSAFKDAAMSFGEGAFNFLKNLASSGKDTASAIDTATKAASGLSTTLSVIGSVVETNIIGDLSASLSEANKNTIHLSQSTNDLFDVFKKAPLIGDFLTKNEIGKKFVSDTQAVMKSAEDIPKMRQYLLQSAAAGGQLNEMLGDMSNIDISKLNEQVKNSAQNMVIYAGTIGTTTEQYRKLYTELQQETPNFLTNQKVKVGDQDLTETQAAMVLAEGTGRKTDDLKTKISELGKTFNMSGQSTLEYIAKLSQANDEFKVGVTTIDAFAKKNIESLTYLSDKGDNSILTLNRMMKGFQDTGLSAKQAAELIGDMTSGIAKMDMAEKGFLSSQTGGAGGLRGAFEIEGLLREGKTDEVMKKIEENIKKNFGGKIFSLKDAQESDYGASQFMMQRELLKSGSFGIKPQNDAQATRILEAMSNGFKPEASDMGEAFDKYAGAGKTLMESNVTSFSTANMVLELEKFENGLRNTNLYFGKIGALSSENRKLVNELNTETQDKSGKKNRTDNRTKEVIGKLGNGNDALGGVMSTTDSVIKGVGTAVDLLKKIGSAFGVTLEDNTQQQAQPNQQNAPQNAAKPEPARGPNLSEREIDDINARRYGNTRNNRPQDQPRALPITQNQPATAPRQNQPATAQIQTTNLPKTPAQASRETALAMIDNYPKTLEVNVNQGSSNNQTATLDGKVVVPTVEMHVDMTCKTCNGKTTEVVVLKSKQNEIGGVTTVPVSRPA